MPLPNLIKLLNQRVIFGKWSKNQLGLRLEERIVSGRFRNLVSTNCQHAKVKEYEKDAENYYNNW